MGLCSERGVSVTFLTTHGKFLARVEGPQNGNVLLRRRQYRLADEEKKATVMAQYFISAKILNSRTVLQRGRRDHPNRVGNSIERTIALMGN